MVLVKVFLKVWSQFLLPEGVGKIPSFCYWRTEEVAGEMLGRSFLAAITALAGLSAAIQVRVPEPWRVAILFQPVVLKCSYDTTATQPPTIIWKYRSFCRDRILDAFSPSSTDNQINDQLQQADPNYNPYVNCPDNSRTVRTVASKMGNAVTLGSDYQGRKVTIINDADLSMEQTAWGDGGVYYCQVASFQDPSGTTEGYVELLVLDWLFVVLVVLGFIVLLILIGVCWCQCCPHTCCCYVRCPCCPEKCCCPWALYQAGKAATAGVPSIYAPSSYAASVYSHPSQAKMQPPLPVMVPMTQFNGGYGSDFDGASSVGDNSRVPLLHDQDAASSVRTGYRIQANQQNDDMRVLYYVEKQLAHFDPRSPGDPSTRYENNSAMSEISSLHEDYDARNNLHSNIGRVRQQAMPAIYDDDERSVMSSASRQTPRRDPRWDENDRYYQGSRQRARSMESLDDIGRRDRSYDRGHQGFDNSRVRRESDSEASSYRNAQDRRRRDYSPERHGEYRKRSRSRDDLTELDRGRRYPRGGYDDSFLGEVLEKKAGARREADSGSSSTARSRNRRDEDSSLPPPSTETESVSSKGKNEKRLRKNDAVSRESLVV
ncbi:lipolysis-stimulated lipoprotein receptor-like isoform X2 [Scyliorhinus canicula]|uniref:lipolysis-stimulated lipoprotein receptor-like isoform X2 n=1 Tax=Scyliorhinus canicula TaxID=7830 RepID=UPI0018F7C36B|nr:lipolysis-stimulated lipoprotein receptor-like isoform X2 [Scyliorhinus canicula]